MHQKNVSCVTIGFLEMLDSNLKLNVCNKGHDSLTMVYSLKNITILSTKAVTFRCLLMGISKNEILKKLHNSVLQDKGTL